MKPWKTLDRAPAPGGGELLLQERDGHFVIRVGGQELMSSRTHGSEEAMAKLAFEHRSPMPSHPRVLIGGLGMGFTVRATLELLVGPASVIVAELSEAVIRWNRELLADVARRPLDDSRVTLEQTDVLARLRMKAPPFDAILLDVDNGPAALTTPANAKLYGDAGIAACHQALGTRGALIVWSAAPDERYLARLRRGGFEAIEKTVPATKTGGKRHILFVARKGTSARR